MGGGPLIPQGNNPQPAAPPAHEVSLGAQQRFNELIGRFSTLLGARAISHMQSRNSRTLADSDVDEAYRELTTSLHVPKLARCLGDAALVIGGILVPFWTTHPLITFSGLALIGLGLYVREFHGTA